MSEENKVESLLRDVNKFNAQCFLKEHMKKLLECRKGLDNIKPYKNFIILEGNPDEAIHQLVSRKNLEPLFDASPAQLSLLIPKLQIYKIFYDENDFSKSHDKELMFRDHTSQKTIDNMFNSVSERGDDVGIKSFSYNFTGKNQAEAGITECELVLYFQNISSLVSEGENGVSYKDLILGGKEKNKKTNEITKYAVKIVIGWADPSDPTNVLIDTKTKIAIKNSKTTLVLSMNDYTMEFKDDGSVELRIKFNSFVDNVLYKDVTNILYLTENGKKAKEIKKELKNENKNNAIINKTVTQKQELDLKPSSIRMGFADRLDKPNMVAEQPIKNVVGEEISKENQMIREEMLDKQERYSRLLTHLYNNSNIFFMDMSREYAEGLDQNRTEQLNKMREKGVINDKEAIASATLVLQEKRKRFSGDIKIYRSLSKDVVDDATKAIKQSFNTKEEIEKDNKGNKIKTMKPLGEEEREKKLKYFEDSQNKKVYSDGTRRIHFFFLGDLMEAALNVLSQNPETKNLNIKVILGSFLYYDPISFIQGKPRVEEVNIADIPISLELFITWYLEKLVKPQSDRMLLGNFINSVMSEIVSPVLEEDCYVNLTGIKQGIQFRYETISAPTNVTLQNGKRVTIEELNNINGDKQTMGDGSYKDIKDISHYIYIYSYCSSYRNLKANYEEDKRRGIYHLFVGGDKGLVKSIQFQKQNQPSVKEARATSDTEDVKRVQGLFTATIRMIGNTLFRLGQYFYIDTSRMSSFLDNPLKKGTIANDLGIGGYYMVHKIEHSFSNNEYVTELSAWRQQENDISSLIKSKITPDMKKTLSKIENVAKQLNNIGEVKKDNKENKDKVVTPLIRDRYGYVARR